MSEAEPTFGQKVADAFEQLAKAEREFAAGNFMDYYKNEKCLVTAKKKVSDLFDEHGK